MQANNYQPIFQQSGQAYNVDPVLMQAIQQTESAGDPNVTSSAGAQGNMQLMPQTAAALGVQNPYVPAQAIPGATKLMAQNLAAFKDPRLAVAAYFGGPDTRQWGPKTSAYVATVAKNYAALKAQAMPASAPAQSSADDLVNAFLSPSSASSSTSPKTAPQPADDLVNAFLTPPSNDNADAPAASTPLAPGDVPMIARGAAGRTANQIAAAQAPVANAIGRVASAAGQAAVAAGAQTPEVIAPQAIRAMDSVGIPGDAINAVAGLPLRAGAAVLGGAQAGVAQIGAELGQPALGRDVAALPEAFAGDAAMVRTAPVDESRILPAPNALMGNVRPDVPAPPNAIVEAASPAPAVPSPRSVGAAATPAAATVMTPREAAANDAAALQQQLTRGPMKGDSTIYVPGSTPTAAEVAGDANISLEQKHYAQNVAPAQFDAQQKANNNARVDLYSQLAGNPDTVRIAEDARDAQASQDLAAAFANKGQADAQPVVDQINSILAGPAGKDDAVVATLNSIKGKLYDPQGALETDPEMLYGVRQAINNLLSKKGAVANPQAQLATSQLMQVKGALDQAIEPAAPGFAQYLKNYSDASKPIDTMNYLQEKMPQIIGAAGMMSQPKFHQMMIQIAKQRAMPGANPAKSIDPETMAGLINLHSDLTRITNLDLGRARGSDTAQNFNLASKLAGQGAHVVAHAVAGHSLPLVGNMLVESGKHVLASRKMAKTQAQQAKRVNELLNPYLNGDGG